ncbi:tRNA preQ1(34) S-adenosylmethionine ribosyltransferase-isomerase QueA [Candidatus Falkowbacteria bacterium RIFOXYB2_FULL_47_14]|uniref:S-adenosylmethionine:tRNA ribosyltransferase-isomerase n=1 Tax=Candidatus Falkowbacteria bacterium RIFOXYA2_FULL_47_19 TaxID=1797994 RepID=A0A1F5SN20_9BACT|nr:MAG: tRNA preQ1(34) S-adenosylmethionine ribosyltransferase-isomerase QueA [Candidatus Falkowbacteria bacterium RIFOXYA2_FULL_47_19]OGF36213.1 MAG: tRNA preQ1(34) S-adenosylmethionine ribosyltransferase-isomerase QueA [Candidatus Falkowbacteria bacterium RIFOXYC2_FULL_46_15]OGF42978.1 MAG: tRNA preQ1(34) S-adenosylmethionine ribosyltransferase-isomerase QueA [Candidatus Falkowbacteria bacterium RIFOXYB2_FULL_47_14]
MRTEDFDYNLPKELIAQEPVEPRDHSRLLCLRLRRPVPTNAGHANKKKEVEIEDRHFYDIIDYLRKGDVLVLNNSKVFPARLIGTRFGTGGKVEVFLVRKGGNNIPGRDVTDRDAPTGRLYGNAGEAWQCLVGGHRRKEGLEVEFDGGLKARVIKNNEDGTFTVEFNKTGKEMMKIVEKIGQMPLPPYIKRVDATDRDATNRVSAVCASTDAKNYQTVYADETKTGSVAAPTAGLHFTPELLEKIKAKGVEIEYITLHVGLGTFAPVKTDNIKEHKMHAEWVEVTAETMANVYLAKHQGRRIITVGTTSARTMEAIASQFPISNFQFPNNIQYPISNIQTDFNKQFEGFQGFVNIFIYPGYEFRIVDAMITNFHLPKSTLLMLISAFAGKDKIDKAYGHAIKSKYRFYSYGDAMFIY